MNQDTPEAKDLGQAILLLSILGSNVRSLTDEIRTLREMMATREELYALRDQLNLRIDALKNEVHSQSVAGTFDRWVSLATKFATLGAIIAAGSAALVAAVHFYDRLPK
jgi:hypothetical protein